MKSVAFASLILLSGLLIAPGNSTAAVVLNGSFETADFTGWGTQAPLNPLSPWTNRANGFNPGFGLFSTAATDGVRSVTVGFDGPNTGSFRLFQDIGVVDVNSNLLTFDVRAGWSINAGAQDRVFNLNVFQSGSFATSLGSFEILRMMGGTSNSDSGNLALQVDLTPFLGQAIRISFDGVLPQSSTGPAFVQFDNVALSVTAVPEPTSLLLCGSIAGAGLIVRRRARKRQNAARESDATIN